MTHTDRQALREAIHADIAEANRAFDKTRHYKADEMLDAIMQKVDAYTEQRVISELQGARGSDYVNDHTKDKVMLAEWVYARVTHRLAQLKASTRKGDKE